MGVNLLGKIKLHEIAKEIGLTSKEVVEKANELGIEAKSHMSSVDEAQAEKIKKAFSKNNAKDANKAVNKEKQKDSKKSETPVIIRRTIVAEEDEKVATNKYFEACL